MWPPKPLPSADCSMLWSQRSWACCCPTQARPDSQILHRRRDCDVWCLHLGLACMGQLARSGSMQNIRHVQGTTLRFPDCMRASKVAAALALHTHEAGRAHLRICGTSVCMGVGTSSASGGQEPPCTTI